MKNVFFVLALGILTASTAFASGNYSRQVDGLGKDLSEAVADATKSCDLFASSFVNAKADIDVLSVSNTAPNNNTYVKAICNITW